MSEDTTLTVGPSDLDVRWMLNKLQERALTLEMEIRTIRHEQSEIADLIKEFGAEGNWRDVNDKGVDIKAGQTYLIRRYRKYSGPERPVINQYTTAGWQSRLGMTLDTSYNAEDLLEVWVPFKRKA